MLGAGQAILIANLNWLKYNVLEFGSEAYIQITNKVTRKKSEARQGSRGERRKAS